MPTLAACLLADAVCKGAKRSTFLHTDTFKDEKRVRKDDVTWMTINGNHIPIGADGKPAGGQPAALGGGGDKETAASYRDKFSKLGLIPGRGFDDDRNVEAMKGVHDQLKAITAKGVELPGTSLTTGSFKMPINFDKASTQGGLAAFKVVKGSDGFKSQELNVNPENWSVAMRDMAASGKSGFLSSSDSSHAMTHELGHMLHERFGNLQAASGQKLSASESKLIGRQVSRYAANNKADMVAEVFAGRMAGKTYSPEVMNMYKAAKGPRIPV